MDKKGKVMFKRHMAALSPESNEAEVEKARARTREKHLSVHYSEEIRPFTTYPYQLTEYLYKTYIAPQNYKSLLDLGCGRGEFLDGFARFDIDVLGIDGSSYPDRPGKAQILTADLDGRVLPIKTDQFDVIFSKSVIEHMHNTDMFLSETFRILKPGGIAIMMAPCWQAQYLHFYDDHTHVKPFTLAGLTSAMQLQSFKIMDSRRFRQLPFLWKYPFLKPVSDVLTLAPNVLKKFKVVRFSKEWMLLVVGQKPEKN